jgi:hypothetical protein
LGTDWKLGRSNFLQVQKNFEEQPSEQPFDENKNGSQFGCLASY